jgi:uncharacterized HAD superfamily protein
MRIGVDLDGVVFNYVDAIRSYLWLSEHEAPDPFKWELWECWGMTEDAFWAEAHEAYEQHLFFKGSPYPGAIEALCDLTMLGHTLHIITARAHPVGQRDTEAWLDSYDVPYDSLTFASDKTCQPVDAFIEDNLHNAEKLVEHGVKAFLLDRPWNQDDTEVPRVLTMTDFVHEVQHLEAQHRKEEECRPEKQPQVRTFATGATRDLDEDKLDYAGFLSPAATKRFAEYMHKNRKMADGSYRSSSNWKKGMPLDSYVQSGFRHFHDVWSIYEGAEVPGVTLEEALCAVWFNVQGLLHEILKEKDS